MENKGRRSKGRWRKKRDCSERRINRLFILSGNYVIPQEREWFCPNDNWLQNIWKKATLNFLLLCKRRTICHTCLVGYLFRRIWKASPWREPPPRRSSDSLRLEGDGSRRTGSSSRRRQNSTSRETVKRTTRRQHSLRNVEHECQKHGSHRQNLRMEVKHAITESFWIEDKLLTTMSWLLKIIRSSATLRPHFR